MPVQKNDSFNHIEKQLKQYPGKTGLYYKNLVTGEELQVNGTEPFFAASVIKLPILVELFFQMQEGRLDGQEEVILKQEDKLPGCGVLSFLHDGIRLTLEDLFTQMIIVSDNTATNLLIRRIGMEPVNRRMESLGFKNTRLNRLLFDSAASAQGIENTISPEDIGRMLEGLYRGTLLPRDASEKILSILKNQQLNGKIPFYLDDLEIAHKTGEDEGITHDVGIVYADQPFVLCICGNSVNVSGFERLMQDTAFALYKFQGDFH